MSHCDKLVDKQQCKQSTSCEWVKASKNKKAFCRDTLETKTIPKSTIPNDISELFSDILMEKDVNNKKK